MTDLSVRRTLVKSPPELWQELSEVEGLARHLAEFGEITITKLEPEHTVAWEGDIARGTVAIESAGWGTKVTMTVALPEESAPEPDPVAEEPDPEPEQPPDPMDELEPSTAELAAIEFTATAPEATEAELEEPEPVPAPARRGFFSRLFRRGGGPVEASEPEPPAAELEPEPLPEPEPEPEPAPRADADEPDIDWDWPSQDDGGAPPEVEPEVRRMAPDEVQAVLDTALENLGSAHHRPFSRG